MVQGQLENSPKCPNEDCGKLLDGYTSVGHDDKPTSGDITVCGSCAWVLQFDDDLQLNVFQVEDYLELGKKQRIMIDKAQHYVISKLEREKPH